MKYVIYPVWAHTLNINNVKDRDLVLNDLNANIDMGRRKVIMWERLARAYSVSGGLAEHAIEADRLQKEYDEAAEPIRVYVYEVVAGLKFVPVYAGGQLQQPARQYRPAPQAATGQRRPTR